MSFSPMYAIEMMELIDDMDEIGGKIVNQWAKWMESFIIYENHYTLFVPRSQTGVSNVEVIEVRVFCDQ